MPTIDTNGVTLAYETLGNPADPPLLLIMGLGSQSIWWPDSFCNALVARGFYVIRFDNRDIGLSTRMTHLGIPNMKMAVLRAIFRLNVKAGYTLADMAKDTVGLLDGLGIAKAHIVGASMGGMIGQIIAADYPARVLSLTSIMSTTGRRGLPGPRRDVSRAMFAPIPKNAGIPALLARSVTIQQMVGSPKFPMTNDEVTQRVAASMQRSISPDGYVRQMLAIFASGDRSAQVKNIRVPTLVIHGTADPLIPVECGRDTARLIPGAVLCEIDGMGHNFPPALDKTLTDMIAAHCRRAIETKQAAA